MADPCDKYMGLVVGPDGQTRGDPYGMIPTVDDYLEWREVAKGIIELVEAEAAQSPQAGDQEKAQALRAQWESMGGAIWQSFQNFPALTWGPSITTMVELATDAACQLGIIESHVIAGGGTPAPKPDAPARTGKQTKLAGKGVLALVGLAVLFFATQRGGPE